MPMMLSLVERGWRGARTCSLELAAQGIGTTHLIKGSVGGDVRALIQPRDGVRIVDVPRGLFRPAVWAYLAGAAVTRRMRWVLADSERTLREVAPWCRVTRAVPLLIRDAPQGYEVVHDGQVVRPSAVFGCAT